MLIVWKGKGAFVILIVVVACLLMNGVTGSVFHDNDYFQKHGWPKLAALWLAGAATWTLGNYLNTRQARVMIDKATGKEVILRPDHSLFFVKMEYWGPGLVLLGIIVALM